jgi:hypothetical protein
MEKGGRSGGGFGKVLGNAAAAAPFYITKARVEAPCVL